MKRLSFLFLLGISPLLAQQNGIDQSSELLTVPTGDKFLHWYGHLGRSYFVQVSDANAPLVKWSWAPIIEAGNNEEISYEVDGTANKGFFRLKYTDVVPLFGETLDNADFDVDGLSNLYEITSSPQTDPLNFDTDGDGLNDGWEVAHSLNPVDSTGINGANGDPDHDGLTNLEEYQLGTNPGDADSDDDGITDGGEHDQGTNPNDPTEKPDAEWFVLSGDMAENVAKTRSRTVTIPAGETRIVIVAVASNEFPEYTGGTLTDSNGIPFLFDDILSWNVQPSSGQTYSDSIDVNSRHDDWLIDFVNGVSFQNFDPIHIESSGVYQAPDDAPLTVQIQLSATNIHDGDLPSTVMVGLLPVNITAIFGKGAGGIAGGQAMYSRDFFEQYLASISLARNGDIWLVKGSNRWHGIKVAADEIALKKALSTENQTVIFDGHANFGIGPNFSNATHKTINSFTNFGTKGATDIPVTYRGNGTEPDVLPYFQGLQPLPTEPPEHVAKILSALANMTEEGWSYLLPATSEIKGDVINTVITPLSPKLKFENTENIGEGGTLTKKGTNFNNEWHFTLDGSTRLIVSAPDSDVPTTLRYKTFFYNSCSSGPHFIENFQHGEFIYTNQFCECFLATQLFVKGVLDGMAIGAILNELEAKNADGNKDEITYEVKHF